LFCELHPYQLNIGQTQFAEKKFNGAASIVVFLVMLRAFEN
jgi:hypothetical protein